MSVFSDRLDKYSTAIADRVRKATSAKLSAAATTAMEGYGKYVTDQKEALAKLSAEEAAKATPLADFPTWVTANGGLNEADQKAAIDYMKQAESVDGGYSQLVKDGHYIAEQTGNFLSKNWPMLAALVAPLLIGNFFEIGTLGIVGLALGGLGLAASQSESDSLLGQVYKWGKTQLGIKPEVEKAPPPRAVAPDKPKETVVVSTGEKNIAMSTGGKIKFNGEEREYMLLGTTDENATKGNATIAHLVLLDKTTKAPSIIPAEKFAVDKLTLSITNGMVPEAKLLEIATKVQVKIAADKAAAEKAAADKTAADKKAAAEGKKSPPTPAAVPDQIPPASSPTGTGTKPTTPPRTVIPHSIPPASPSVEKEVDAKKIAALGDFETGNVKIENLKQTNTTVEIVVSSINDPTSRATLTGTTNERGDVTFTSREEIKGGKVEKKAFKDGLIIANVGTDADGSTIDSAKLEVALKGKKLTPMTLPGTNSGLPQIGPAEIQPAR